MYIYAHIKLIQLLLSLYKCILQNEILNFDGFKVSAVLAVTKKKKDIRM